MNSLTPRKKEKTYTEKEIAFLEALSGPAKGDVSKAMDIAGYASSISPTQIRRQLREEIIDIAKDFLAASSIKAVVGLDDVLDRPGQLGAKQKIDAAKQMLDRAGIVAPTDDININIHGTGVIFLPTKKVPNKFAEQLDALLDQGPIIDVETETVPTSRSADGGTTKETTGT